MAGVEQDVVDRLSDIYTCADQLKSFSKYIHHHKTDTSFDPRFVFEDIVHHLTDSIFDLQNVTASRSATPTTPQKNYTSRSSTPTKNQITNSPVVSRRSTPTSDPPRTPPSQKHHANFNSPSGNRRPP